MAGIDAASLTRDNLMYREPALYDELLACTSLARDLVTLLARHNPDARTVLDLGCGTARLLAELDEHGLAGTGIDIQPGLVGWARRTHPALRLEVGDLRVARLGTTFDLVVCVGNALSYLHTDAELAAAFETFRAHSRPGSLLVLSTLTGTGRNDRGDGEVTTSIGPATVTMTSEWDPVTRAQTTGRRWRFSDGRVEHDTMHRRFWDAALLAAHARDAGFGLLPANPEGVTLCAARREEQADPVRRRGVRPGPARPPGAPR